MATATQPPSRRTSTIAPDLEAAGILTPEERKQAKRIRVARERATELKSEAQRIANTDLPDWERRFSEHLFDTVSGSIDAEELTVEPFEDPKPDLALAEALAVAALEVANAEARKFNRLLDYEDMFGRIEEAWSEVEKAIDPDTPYREVVKLQAKQDTRRSVLLTASLRLGEVESDTRKERTAHRRAQKEANRPVNLNVLREEWASAPPEKVRPIDPNSIVL